MSDLGRQRRTNTTAAILLVTALCSLDGQAEDMAPRRKPLFTADEEACFGQVYAKRHLTSHPNQKVTGLYVFRYLQQRSDAENWRPNDRREAIERFRQSGKAWVQAFVTFRDRPGYYHNWLVCSEGSGSSAHCFVECDGGTFDMKRESATTVLLYNHGFELVGGCAQPDNIERVDFLPGEDDKLFRLESVPVAVCRAEEEKAMPIRAGRPLRERFGQDEVFCFGRDYDPGHLAGHPQQQVTSIRIGRLAPEKEWVYNDPTRVWPDDVRLTVLLKLKAGAARRGLQYVCRPQEASWRCTAESSPDAISSCGDGTIYLTRTSGEDIVLINPREGLPIETACQAQPPSERALTHSDDKVFRVTQMPIAACR